MNLYGISNSIKGNNANAVSELSDVFRNTKELEKEIEECKYLEKCCYNIINDFNINQIEKLLDYYFLLSENSEKLNNYVYIATVLEKNIDDETTENVNAIYSKTMDIFDNITRIINNIQEDDLLLSNFKYKKYIDYIKKEQSFKLNKEDLLELSNLIFYDIQKDGIISTSQVNCFFKRACEKCGIEKRGQHALRHTFATRCIEANVPAIVLKKWLGHTDIHITLDTYADVFDSMYNDSIAKFDNYIVNVVE